MPAVDHEIHARLGALARTRRETERELSQLKHRSDAGGVERRRRLEVHLERLGEQESKLTRQLEYQEAVQRQHGLSTERQAIAQLLRSQGIPVATAPGDEGVEPAVLSGVTAGSIRMEGGADQAEEYAPASTATDARTQGGDPWAVRGGALAQSPTDLRGRALRAVELVAKGGAVPDAGSQRVTAMLERGDPHSLEAVNAARWMLAVSNPAYADAVGLYLSDPLRGHMRWTPEQRAAFDRAEVTRAALQLGDLTSGAALMSPFELDPSIAYVGDGVSDPLRELATVITTTASEWRGVSSGGFTGSWADEGDEVADHTPTLGQPTIRPEKHHSAAVYSYEAGQDVPSLQAELAQLFAQYKAEAEGAAFVSGAGPGATPREPTGLVTALVAAGGLSVVAPATAEAFTLPDLYALQLGLPPGYQDNAVWLGSLGTFHEARQFVAEADASNAKVFSDDGQRLLGRRWRPVSSMDSSQDIDAGVTAQNHVLIYGDIRASYRVVDRVPTVLQVVPRLGTTANLPTGENIVYLHWRVGAGLVNANAARLLSIPTTA